MISDDGGDDIDFHDGRVRCAQRCTDGQTDRQTRTHSYEALAVAVAHSCLCFSITAEGGESLSTLIRRVRCWWRGLDFLYLCILLSAYSTLLMHNYDGAKYVSSWW
ncbi:unnamed protein product [Brugia pahangi]|uniref:Ion_trans domain-containing protein n=1 Tax=Brugia pahangi TaxID=6280 RepID=A0A0N4T6L5_BRUPA|nr:unnamed protein product [Brugia pahangi]